MPKLGKEIYAAHRENVMRLARREGGVSRAELIQELNVSRPVVNKLIEETGLVLVRKEGRAEFFAVPSVKQSTAPALPPEVEEVVVPTGDEVVAVALPLPATSTLADLDTKILETRDMLIETAARAGKAYSSWVLNQAKADALRTQLTELTARRLGLSD